MMGKQGKLKVKDFGYTMPVSDPAIQSPPYYGRNIENFYIAYETDYESAAEMLPEDLAFSEDPPVAAITLSNLPFSTIGPYKEAILSFSVTYEGKNYDYLPNLFTTQEMALIPDREIWGYGKKLAFIDFKKEREEIISYVERPVGNRILTAVMRPEINLKKEDWQMGDILSLKLIPSAEKDKGPDVLQLIGCALRFNPIVGSDGIAELWRGKGNVVFNNPTEIDAWYRAPVKRVIDCIYGWFNTYLPHGYIVKDYLSSR